jgi:amino acid transporter
MAALSYPSYVPTAWQGTLITMAVTVFSLFFNTVGAKHLPLFESIILFLHIFGFFAILIPLWVLAPKAPAKAVFTEFANFGGWSSIGGACMIGQLTAIGSLGGSDSPARTLNILSDPSLTLITLTLALDLAEEVRHAAKVVPRMMITTICLNGKPDVSNYG